MLHHHLILGTLWALMHGWLCIGACMQPLVKYRLAVVFDQVGMCVRTQCMRTRACFITLIVR